MAIMIGHQLIKLGAAGRILSALGEGATPQRTPAHSLSQAKRPARPHPNLYGRSEQRFPSHTSAWLAMPMIAWRALPSRLTLVVRCMPTREHICKHTHAHSPRQEAVAPSSPSPVGHSRACDPFPAHMDAHIGTAVSWLLKTRRMSASARRHKVLH